VVESVRVPCGSGASSARSAPVSPHDGYLRRVCRWAIGEVLARQSSAGTPRGVVRAWMQSPPHREVLLDGRFRQIGIAARVGAGAVLTTADLAVVTRHG
jgi:uncharacterized protein YkwD